MYKQHIQHIQLTHIVHTMSNNDKLKYNVGADGRKAKLNINTNVIKNIIKQRVNQNIYQVNISKEMPVYMACILEKLFVIIFTATTNNIETVQEFINSISNNRKLIEVFSNVLYDNIIEHTYLSNTPKKTLKLSEHIDSKMFKNILENYNITNINLTYEISELLNAMMFYICKKITKVSLHSMHRSRRKTISSLDVTTAVSCVFSESIATELNNYGILCLTRYCS